MTAKFFALLTNIGAAKLANATALGTRLEITHMAVGDGGGTLPTPNPAQIKLVNEQRRSALNMLTIDPINTSQIIAEQVIPETEGGWWIREIGLLDKDGDLVAIANCAETYKPQLQEGSGRTQTIRVILIVSSTAAVTLKIDPSVVLATRKYVDDKVIEVKQYADNLLAEHIKAINPHSQYLQVARLFSEIKAMGPESVALALEHLDLGEDKFHGRLLRVSKFSESAVYKKPLAKRIKVTVVGGGGGAGGTPSTGANQVSMGSGGGSGGTSISFFDVDDLTYPIELTVGKGGMGGVGSVEPTSGTSSSFGNYMSSENGSRAASGIAFEVGSPLLMSNGGGGIGIGGNHLNIRGGAGTPAISIGAGYESGAGGHSSLSAGGNPISAGGSAIPGEHGLLGSGGSGAYAPRSSGILLGGNGGDGIIIIEEYA
ncbi:phage tail protein [Yersinia hibernica]|uniref:Phage tail protein n=1 Tax=Yersinia hibernica TaxID=2339259 RepID=A0ABX5R0C5_9GAMM|nr:phage tail protein [Yersinia hibernica]QAX78938.1 phage tail protein [Yersinia hibernica]